MDKTVFVVFPNDSYNFSFCLKIPVSGWLECFADIAVSTSDMSLFRNCKNSKKCDGLIPNDPQSHWILLYQWLPQLLLPGCNFTVDTSVSAIG